MFVYLKKHDHRLIFEAGRQEAWADKLFREKIAENRNAIMSRESRSPLPTVFLRKELILTGAIAHTITFSGVRLRPMKREGSSDRMLPSYS